MQPMINTDRIRKCQRGELNIRAINIPRIKCGIKRINLFMLYIWVDPYVQWLLQCLCRLDGAAGCMTSFCFIVSFEIQAQLHQCDSYFLTLCLKLCYHPMGRLIQTFKNTIGATMGDKFTQLLCPKAQACYHMKHVCISVENTYHVITSGNALSNQSLLIASQMKIYSFLRIMFMTEATQRLSS